MISGHGVTVTITRTSVDRFGDRVQSDGQTVAQCGLAPTGSSEDTNRRDQVTTRMTLYAPPEADIRATDTVVLPGGDRYEVVGQVADWHDPYTGWHPGQVVELERITG